MAHGLAINWLALPTSRVLSQLPACSSNFPPRACMPSKNSTEYNAVRLIKLLHSFQPIRIYFIMYIKQLSNFPLISVTFLSLQASTFVRALWNMSHRASKTRYVTAAMNGFVDTVLVICHFAKRTTRTFCLFFFFSVFLLPTFYSGF